MAQNLQLLRNSAIAATREEAIEKLEARVATMKDGEIALGRYQSGANVRTLICVAATIGADGGIKHTIFDADAIPSEVQDKIDEVVEAIKGGNDDEIDDKYDTIKEIADALVIINGADNVEGSIAKAEKDAKEYADTQITAAVGALDKTDAAVAGQYVDSVSETDGIITVTRKPVTSTKKTITIGTTKGLDVDVNIDGATIVRNPDNGQLSVASAALVQYVGADAIKVSEVSEEDNTKTISLTVNAADQVLTNTVDGLRANINLTWDKQAGLKLIGKNSTEIATIPATDFIKDGMLENVELKTASAGSPVGEAQEGTFLVFTFNTDGGSKVINLNVTSLIDVYTAGNGIEVAGKVISAKIDGTSESYLTVGADGIKLSGVKNAIDAAVLVETNRAKAEETRLADTVIGEDALPDGKTVMAVIEENEEVAAQAIAKLATAAGLLNGEEVAYVAPTGSQVFSSTTSIMNMLNVIASEWDIIDGGTY